jgi:hypothetical protein
MSVASVSTPGSLAPTRTGSEINIDTKEPEPVAELPWPIWNSGPAEMCINGLPISLVFQNVHTQLETLKTLVERPVVEPPKPEVNVQEIIRGVTKMWQEERTLLEARIVALETVVQEGEAKAVEKEAAFRETINADIRNQQADFELKMKKVVSSSVQSISVEIHKEMAVAADKIEVNFGGRINANHDNITRLEEVLRNLKCDFESKNVEFRLKHDDIDARIAGLNTRFQTVDVLVVDVEALKVHAGAMQVDLDYIGPIVRSSAVSDLVERVDAIQKVNDSLQRQCSSIASMNDRIREDLSIYMQRFKQAETDRNKLSNTVKSVNSDVNGLVLGTIPEIKNQIVDMILKKADLSDVRHKVDMSYLEEVRDLDNQYVEEIANKIRLMQEALLKQDALVTDMPIELYKNLDSRVEELTKWCESQIRANNEMLFNYQRAKARDHVENRGFPSQTGAQSAIGVRCLSCKQPVVDVNQDIGMDHEHLLLTSTLPPRDGSPTQHKHDHRHEPHTPYFNSNTTVVGEDQQKLLQNMMDSAAASPKSSQQHPPKFSKLVRLLAVTNEQVEAQSPVGRTGAGSTLASLGGTAVSNMTDEDPVPSGLTIMENGQLRSPLDASYSNLIASPNSPGGKIPVLSQIHSGHKQKDFVSWRPLMADSSKKAIDKVLHPGSSKMQIVKTMSDSQFAEVNRALHGHAPGTGATTANHSVAASATSTGSQNNGVIHHIPGSSVNTPSRVSRPSSAPATKRHN